MDDIELLIEAAREHGEESDPDHEVGDLQDLVRLCWAELSPEARAKIIEEHQS